MAEKKEKQVYLLDCTLRDGGYLIDWKFGKENIVNIFERVVNAGVDIIEVGFLDQRREFDPDRTIIPDTESAAKIFGRLNRKDTMVVGMIDYGTCGIDNLQPCAGSCLDGIRVIFKKEYMHPAMEFCGQVKALGYQVFSQAVSITSYSDEELGELVGLVNECMPFALSMVDTYGLCDASMLRHIVSVLDRSLSPDITLGYHAHNNFQLGYANAISVLESGIPRDILVDGTLYGMGKSAGNAPIELLAMYMNRAYEKEYSVTQLQEAIQSSILDFYHKRPWGYTMFYYIAALNLCHPDYVSYLVNRRTLSITAINRILQMIPAEKKLQKDMALIESLYLEYQKRECDDSRDMEKLTGRLIGRSILLVGPGSSVLFQRKVIAAYQEEHRCLTVAINYIPEQLRVDYVFLTNSRRYLQMSHKLMDPQWEGIPVIATSNVESTDRSFSYTLNYSALIDESFEFPDNSMVMLLKALMKMGVSDVALAGFDGYTVDNINFVDTNMEYSFIREKADRLNQYVKTFFWENRHNLKLEFVTKSLYQEDRS